MVTGRLTWAISSNLRALSITTGSKVMPCGPSINLTWCPVFHGHLVPFWRTTEKRVILPGRQSTESGFWMTRTLFSFPFQFVVHFFSSSPVSFSEHPPFIICLMNCLNGWCPPNPLPNPPPHPPLLPHPLLLPPHPQCPSLSSSTVTSTFGNRFWINYWMASGTPASGVCYSGAP